MRTLWERIGQGRRLSGAAQGALVGYDWPGNLRQLVASLRTLVALSEPGSEIGEDALPAYLRTRLPTAMPSRPATVATADLDAITLSSMRAAVEACGGNIARAARQLGVSRSTLYRRLGADPRAS